MPAARARRECVRDCRAFSRGQREALDRHVEVAGFRRREDPDAGAEFDGRRAGVRHDDVRGLLRTDGDCAEVDPRRMDGDRAAVPHDRGRCSGAAVRGRVDLRAAAHVALEEDERLAVGVRDVRLAAGDDARHREGDVLPRDPVTVLVGERRGDQLSRRDQPLGGRRPERQACRDVRHPRLGRVLVRIVQRFDPVAVDIRPDVDRGCSGKRVGEADRGRSVARRRRGAGDRCCGSEPRRRRDRVPDGSVRRGVAELVFCDDRHRMGRADDVRRGRRVDRERRDRAGTHGDRLAAVEAVGGVGEDDPPRAGGLVDAPHTGAVVRLEPYHWSDYLGATRPTGP